MKSVTYFIFVLLEICTTRNASLTAQTLVSDSRYRFQHFTIDDGLPTGYIGSIVQDSLGFVWMQAFFGLCRYDGYTFKVFRPDPDDLKLLRDANGPLYTDPSGNLWMTAHTVTKEFPLTKYNAKTESFTRYIPAIDGQLVHTFRFDKREQVIWFGSRGKGLYYFNYRTLETRRFVNHQADSLLREKVNIIHGISDRDSCLLLSGPNGLWIFDKKKQVFSRPAGPSLDSALFYHSQIWSVHEGDSLDNGDVWLWFDRYILRVDRSFSVIKRLKFPDGVYTNGYVRDHDGVFWFATYENGLYRFDPHDDSLVNIKAVPGDEKSLKGNYINSIEIDRDQNIWLATPHGVSRLQKEWIPFQNFTFKGTIAESTIYRTREKDFLVLGIFGEVGKGEIKILISEILPNSPDSLIFQLVTHFPGGTIHGMLKGKSNFWISVYGSGIVRIPIDPYTGMIVKGYHELLSHDPSNENTISSDFTTCIWEDAGGNLWVGTRGKGLNKINEDIPYEAEGSVTRYKHNESDSGSIRNDIVWNLYQDGDQLWVFTDDGADLLHNGRFGHVFENNIVPIQALKTKNNILVFVTSDGLYQGTRPDGRSNGNLKVLLKADNVVRAQEDRAGKLWISTTKGIICYNLELHSAIEFGQKDGFSHTRATNPFFREHETSTGAMVISDLDGITIFDPASLKISQARTFPALTGLQVNSRKVPIQRTGVKAEQFSIDVGIGLLRELVLDHQHNNFTLEFSAMEMTSPEKNIYRHKLEGYDGDWIKTDWNNRTATYTNMDAGDYVFKVQASNHHGIWSDEERTLAVRILPPPWKSWWAYSLYGLAFLGITMLWRRYDIQRIKLKHRTEHLVELDNLKSRFFTNISHEFRTPITLILGPLMDLSNRSSIENPKDVLAPVIRNAKRLLRLINQLLDLNKLEAGKMNLQTAVVDMVLFLKEISASYESYAADKDIRYFFYHEVPQLMACIDPGKIEKVTHNILSNAFKFTKEGGEVILYLKTAEENAIITVKDTGIGIPSDQLDKVFDRFYQVDSSQTRGYEGSGLGMALAKELVELHGGKIDVASTEGRGTIFTVSIPLRTTHLSISEGAPSVSVNTESTIAEEQFEHENGELASDRPQITPLPSGHPVVLIVEDNADMRQYIRKSLSEFYHIQEAADGSEGLDKAREMLPDLIVTDIMMPLMDGYHLCKEIKTHELTSHIPVILLTAKADHESKLAGLETGADDYLTKPFDANELRLIIRNRVEERRAMRERYSRNITLGPSQIAVTSLDERFLKKAIELIETNMEDENFSMEDFSHEAGYSRMQFYRKIKALSGQTPSEFVRTIRLKRAAQMLSKRSDNITQIAYSVGFRSLAYFNKCFKEQYGVTPGQFSAAEHSDQ